MPYTLPALPFAYNALEPILDAQTLQLHHAKHHQGYIDALNALIAPHPDLQNVTIEQLMRQLERAPVEIRKQIHDQGGGHANHLFFWQTLTPNAEPRPSGDLLQLIEASFGSFEAFKARFESSGMRHVGSGWVVLVCKAAQKFELEVRTLQNQDCLLTQGDSAIGLLICDVWEGNPP
jgi:superoxide dismutase, Fe-Mn family